MEELLLYFSLKYDGNFNKIFDALKSKEAVDEKLRSELFETFYKSSSAKFTTLVSDNYPAKLKEISCPPLLFFTIMEICHSLIRTRLLLLAH